jgi:hypothetical protein
MASRSSLVSARLVDACVMWASASLEACATSPDGGGGRGGALTGVCSHTAVLATVGADGRYGRLVPLVGLAVALAGPCGGGGRGGRPADAGGATGGHRCAATRGGGGLIEPDGWGGPTPSMTGAFAASLALTSMRVVGPVGAIGWRVDRVPGGDSSLVTCIRGANDNTGT